MSAASDDVPPPHDEPTRALLLAQALDVCISAERRLPGSAENVIAYQPTWAREELRRLVSLAGSLEAVSTNAVMSDEFRVAARSRLLQRVRGGARINGTASTATEKYWAISAFPSTNGYHATVAPRGKRRRWLWRGGLGGILAATLATTATLTASATAMPGEPLYSIKQAHEELDVRLAPDDQARALAFLSQGDARLNETARLLQAGRTSDIAQTTQRFNEAVDRATTTFVVTIAATPSEAPATESIETKLSAQQAQLESLISSAPEPARADLRQALTTTERGLALVADTQADQSVDQSTVSPSSVAATVPTTAAEAIPTVGQPQVVQASPPASGIAASGNAAPGTVADRREASQNRASQTAQETVAQAPTAPPGRVLAAPRRQSPRPATSQGAENGENAENGDQHFEPVATDSAAIAQAPQLSQQPPRHLDIKLSDDSSGAAGASGALGQSDGTQNDARQVTLPTTRTDDSSQAADQQSQGGSAHASASRGGANDDSPASANAPAANTAQVQATQVPSASAQNSTSAHGEGDKSSHNDNPSASHASSDDHSFKSGGDQGGKPTADQGSKGGSDGGSRSGGDDSGSKGSGDGSSHGTDSSHGH